MRPHAPLLLASLVMAGCGASAPPAASRPAPPAEADYAAHVRGVRQKLAAAAPDVQFHVVVQKPFVVIGDGTPDEVRTSAERTVKWAVDHLRRDFFDKDPADILDVYLFKDKASYDLHTRRLFNDTPTTPYGYYAPRHKALIMNINTGGGTLVHEIVHPYMAANFPACPSWFNEGLGSLFEQSSERDGHIVGLTNWRLAGLQTAIRAGKLPAFQELLAMDAETFYGVTRGVNYAASRYLLYYLQERGLLREYYRTFLKNHGQDPTGYATLARLLKVEDVPAFQKQWEQWVLGLRFP